MPIKQGLAGSFIRRFLMNYVITGSYLLLGLVALVAALVGRPILFVAWLIGSVAIFVAYSIRKRSSRKAFNDLLVTFGLIVGFITGGQDADQYPTDVKVLQHQSKEINI